MSENTQIYHLLIIKDPVGNRVAHLNAATYSIGRDQTDSIQVSDPTVSRHHAVLIRVPIGNQAYSYRLMDGDASGKPSKNGLFINGSQCRTHCLSSNDSIQLGQDVSLIYFVESFTEEEFASYCHDGHIKFHRIQEAILDPTATLITESLNNNGAIADKGLTDEILTELFTTPFARTVA